MFVYFFLSLCTSMYICIQTFSIVKPTGQSFNSIDLKFLGTQILLLNCEKATKQIEN